MSRVNENNERNEHFQGFAKLTLQRLMHKYDHLPPGQWGPTESDEIILAQCAYDLLYFLIDQTCPAVGAIHESISLLPDLTAWPPQDQP